jgi:hypothetical protein
VCTWTEQVQGQTVAGRISKPALGGNGKVAKNSDVQSRLDRLELLLEKAVTAQGTTPQTYVRSSTEIDRRDHDAHLMPSPNSYTSVGPGMAADDGDGVLLLDEGRSQFVSSLHFALLADEVGILQPLVITEAKHSFRNSTNCSRALLAACYVDKLF